MSRGPGAIQRIILDTLADGPASSGMLYQECHEHDERAVRRALGRLWEDDDIRRLPNLAAGMGVWCLPLDERELDESRELPRWREWNKSRGLPYRGPFPRSWPEIDALVEQRALEMFDGILRQVVEAQADAKGLSDAEAEAVYEAMKGLSDTAAGA